MDDGKRTNFELTPLVTLSICLFLLMAPATGAPFKEGALPSAEPPAGEKEPVVFAESAAVIDSFTGSFLFLKNESAIQYPASSTKILTALLVIEAGNLDKPVTVEISDTKVEPTKLDLQPGEQYTRRQLIYGLLLKSANDVAVAL